MRKSVFSQQDVVDAGLALMGREGLGKLTARKVAEELGSSTAPVYSNFSNMDDLGVAVKQAAVGLLLEFTSQSPTDNEFLNIGVGVLEFARIHPQLYVALFMQRSGDCEAGPLVMEKMLETMAEVPALGDLVEVERILLLRKMAIFTHGLATQVCNGYVTEDAWPELIHLLEEVGDAITADAFAHSPRQASDLAQLGSFCKSPREILDEAHNQTMKADGDD